MEDRPVPPPRKKRGRLQPSPSLPETRTDSRAATPAAADAVSTRTTAGTGQQAPGSNRAPPPPPPRTPPPRPPRPRQRPFKPPLQASLSLPTSGATKPPSRPAPPLVRQQAHTPCARLPASGTAGGPNESFVRTIDSKVSKEHYLPNPRAEDVPRSKTPPSRPPPRKISLQKSSSQINRDQNAPSPTLRPPTPIQNDGHKFIPSSPTSEAKRTTSQQVANTQFNSAKQKPQQTQASHAKLIGSKSLQLKPERPVAAPRKVHQLSTTGGAKTRVPPVVQPCATTVGSPAAVKRETEDGEYSYVDLSKWRYVHIAPKDPAMTSGESNNLETTTKATQNDLAHRLKPADSSPSHRLYASLQSQVVPNSSEYAIPHTEGRQIPEDCDSEAGYTALASISIHGDTSPLYTIPNALPTTRNDQHGSEANEAYTPLMQFSKNDSSIYQVPGADAQ